MAQPQEKITSSVLHRLKGGKYTGWYFSLPGRFTWDVRPGTYIVFPPLGGHRGFRLLDMGDDRDHSDLYRENYPPRSLAALNRYERRVWQATPRTQDLYQRYNAWSLARAHQQNAASLKFQLSSSPDLRSHLWWCLDPEEPAPLIISYVFPHLLTVVPAEAPH